MEHKTKKNLRLLAEKFSHSIMYDKDTLLLKSSLNTITIVSKDKDIIKVKYNIGNGTEEVEISNEEIYDIIIELLRRKGDERVNRKEGEVLNLNLFIEEEGNFAENTLETLTKEIEEKGITYKSLSGNRVLAEYYKGIIILTDDLTYFRSNVLEFN